MFPFSVFYVHSWTLFTSPSCWSWKKVDDGNNDSYKAWDKDGNEVEIDRGKVDAWIDPNEYKDKRQVEYPDIGDQLDALYHAGAFPEDMANKIKAVKDKYPKT